VLPAGIACRAVPVLYRARVPGAVVPVSHARAVPGVPGASSAAGVPWCRTGCRGAGCRLSLRGACRRPWCPCPTGCRAVPGARIACRVPGIAGRGAGCRRPWCPSGCRAVPVPGRRVPGALACRPRCYTVAGYRARMFEHPFDRTPVRTPKCYVPPIVTACDRSDSLSNFILHQLLNIKLGVFNWKSFSSKFLVGE